ncbi:MAG: dephospho-CoA kinase [Flavobacterium sp. JAD_PAG50586_2]|nr:MAG: dephospho-CoA kinase [Flavobacterium sp. JAD_PAG50586_2]
MSKIIGLTGGIGSGKTMIANYIKSLGIPVYIADDEARALMNTNEIVQMIVSEFGREVLLDNQINREALANIVFNNPEKLKRLNNIVHPAVKKHFNSWVGNHKNHPLLFKEAAILFESGSYKDCDAVVTVTAPLETRLQRVAKRDKSDRESILKRMEHQWTDEERIANSDYVIQNLTVEDTKKQFDEILNLLKNR